MWLREERQIVKAATGTAKSVANAPDEEEEKAEEGGEMEVEE